MYFSFPIYSLCLAITNDRLEPDCMVAASSFLVLVTGLGAITGPLVVGAAMSLLGTWTFFGYLCLVHSSVGLYTWYRIKSYPGVPTEDQGSYVYLARTSPVSAATAYGDEPEEEGTAGAE